MFAMFFSHVYLLCVCSLLWFVLLHIVLGAFLGRPWASLLPLVLLMGGWLLRIVLILVSIVFSGYDLLIFLVFFVVLMMLCDFRFEG